MEWYTILGLCLGGAFIIYTNIWYNRYKWKKWIATWTDGERNQEDLTAFKEAVASFATAITEMMVLIATLKKDTDVGE